MSKSDRPIPPDAVCVDPRCEHRCETLHWCSMTGHGDHPREFILCDDCIERWRSRSPTSAAPPTQPAMSERKMRQETRKQGALNRLGTDNPMCACCPETNYRCMELHHLAGKDFDEFLVNVCRNCHRKLSDMQKDQPAQLGTPPTTPERIGHFLDGLADLLILIAEKLKEFAVWLIEEARRNPGQA